MNQKYYHIMDQRCLKAWTKSSSDVSWESFFFTILNQELRKRERHTQRILFAELRGLHQMQILAFELSLFRCGFLDKWDIKEGTTQCRKWKIHKYTPGLSLTQSFAVQRAFNHPFQRILPQIMVTSLHFSKQERLVIAWYKQTKLSCLKPTTAELTWKRN